MVLLAAVLGISSFLFVLCKLITFCCGVLSRCYLSLRTALRHGSQPGLKERQCQGSGLRGHFVKG